MGSIQWTVRNRVVEPGKLVRTPEGWTEPAPETCHNGHPFGQGRGTVGWEPCRCGGHRTHTCGTCHDVVQWPENSPECEDGTFDGRAGNQPAGARVQSRMELNPIPQYEPAASDQREPDEQATETWRAWLTDRADTEK